MEAIQADNPTIRLSLELRLIVSVIPKREALPPFDSSGFCRRTCRHGPPDEAQVATAIAYLKLVTPTKHPTVCSYRLKHLCEDWARRNGLEERYIANGAMIQACIRLGLVIEPRGINGIVGVSRRDVRALKAT